MRALIDIVSDILIDLSARRAKVILTLTAVAFATGALSAAVGVARMAENQIDTNLAATVTDRVTITRTTTQTSGDDTDRPPANDSVDAMRVTFPAGSLKRVESIEGVLAAGLKLPLTDGIEATGPTGATAPTVELAGITSGYLTTIGTTTRTAWALDQPADTIAQIAIISADVATAAGIPTDADTLTGYTITVLDETYQVVDVIHGPAARGAVLIPYDRALAARGGDWQATMRVLTRPGAAHPITRVLREAVNPAAPDTLTLSHTADLSTLRTGVATQLGQLIAAIGGLLVILTGLLIANNMVIAVTARTAEIGLRRALGASRSQIASLFITEATLTGLLGGLAGSALATTTTATVAAINQWDVVFTPWHAALGPAIGLTVAIAGTLHPAIRAAHTAPATAIRTD
ncbi:protein of unknown function DUF214 [Xylanimonas cellulosilytica DSM 15894]|uniref:ABC3 transporter permease C-terminal domain-containing protein n=1 Tax=Xylanimonas cellulosilytica (strain DSM 15894 / JCM 12276 / CECT 5975 / KCTC 9989 / LMG 20990 / NBRC 107835 / XIL07) TaxID=446471 RepID=D1BY10_XYLCX|nr:ABC transporter permease [Xylanimonas cellulosilytica]ACZ29853.1 protein of unknown function DUF214 [Xylanimonas cellulosilytica DSM 15894]